MLITLNTQTGEIRWEGEPLVDDFIKSHRMIDFTFSSISAEKAAEEFANPTSLKPIPYEN